MLIAQTSRLSYSRFYILCQFDNPIHYVSQCSFQQRVNIVGVNAGCIIIIEYENLAHVDKCGTFLFVNLQIHSQTPNFLWLMLVLCADISTQNVV